MYKVLHSQISSPVHHEVQAMSGVCQVRTIDSSTERVS